MNSNLNELIALLEEASIGSGPDIKIVRSLKWETSDELLDRVATESWLRLKNFVDDSDLRSRDVSYDEQMKSEMRWRAEELFEMSEGKDPYQRRKNP